MNRALDYRTDFYSLGVTFYELITGQLPFNSSDPLEIIHYHLAKQPIPPHKIKTNIPEMISKIILKMMAKNSEERYQSAWGIKADLELYLEQWRKQKMTDHFLLGQNDISETFQIPQKLYGREQEIRQLLNVFERVSQGYKEIMLITGYSGIGKSVLVEKIYKPIARHKGYFISGKFDQLQKNIPYASLIQALSELVRQILTETTEEILQWREKISATLGDNGQVIIEVIPEVKLIIGEQPSLTILPPTEAQNRFNFVLQNFIAIFAEEEHPIVIFMDDLQWADLASLIFLQSLMGQQNIQYLFLICAYQDNEIKPGVILDLFQS